MQEYTISKKTRQELLDVFDNNHNIELKFFIYSEHLKTSRDREAEYLEELRMNPSLPMPQGLIYRTMTGIEEQIKQAPSGTSFGLYLEYEEPSNLDIESSRIHVKKFLIQKA